MPQQGAYTLECPTNKQSQPKGTDYSAILKTVGSLAVLYALMFLLIVGGVVALVSLGGLDPNQKTWVIIGGTAFLFILFATATSIGLCKPEALLFSKTELQRMRELEFAAKGMPTTYRETDIESVPLEIPSKDKVGEATDAQQNEENT